MMKAIQKSSENTNTKTKTKTKTTTKTKTQTKCLKTQHMLYFWNPDDLLIPNMMIDTSPWSCCSRWSPWLACSGHTISSTGPSVSPFRDFLIYNLGNAQKNFFSRKPFPSPDHKLTKRSFAPANVACDKWKYKCWIGEIYHLYGKYRCCL